MGKDTDRFEIAAAVGAVTIAFSTLEDKLDLLRELGATHVFNYQNNPNWSQDVLKVTEGRGADHVVDVVGAATIAESLRALRQDGLVSAIGFLSGSEKHDLIPDLVFGARTSRFRAILSATPTDLVRSPRPDVWESGDVPGDECVRREEQHHAAGR